MEPQQAHYHSHREPFFDVPHTDSVFSWQLNWLSPTCIDIAVHQLWQISHIIFVLWGVSTMFVFWLSQLDIVQRKYDTHDKYIITVNITIDTLAMLLQQHRISYTFNILRTNKIILIFVSQIYAVLCHSVWLKVICVFDFPLKYFDCRAWKLISSNNLAILSKHT